MSIKGLCKFYEKLYIGKGIKNERLVKWKLRHGAGQLNIYVITASAMEHGQLEIRHSGFLKQKYYKRHPVFVYGIAKGYGEALDIIMKISDEAYKNGMGGDLRGYLNAAEAQA